MTLMTLLTIMWPTHFQSTFSLKTGIPWLTLFWENESGTQSNERNVVFSASLG